MEIFNNLIQTLTTPNEELTNIICSPLIFVEAIISMLLFTTILNIKSTTKQNVIYVLSMTISAFITRFLVSTPYGTFINIIIALIITILCFKISIFKAIICQLLPFACTVLIETILFKFLLLAFNLNLDIVTVTPLYRFLSMIGIYVFYFILYRFIKHFNFNTSLLENIDRKNKIPLIIAFILAAIMIGIQLYLTMFYSDNLPVIITVLSLISLIAYFFITIYSLSRTTKLEVTKQNLEETTLYNKTLTILHDNMRCFKHDFNNILQAIGGYIQINDMEGLKKYYKQILKDCDKVNNLYVLSPDVINNPAIYSILASKYYSADAKGITISLDVFLDLNDLKMQVYEFTRILGILLDNAIEASSECDEKIINITIRNEENKHRQVLIISNTYPNKDVDTEKIYEKAYTTKPNNTGLGLWEVRKILKKHNNLNLFTTKNNEFFTQQLEIYY